MSTTDPPRPTLEEEFESLAYTERKLEHRAERLESFHLVTIIAAFAGFALGLAALIVSLVDHNGSGTTVVQSAPAAQKPAGTPMPMVAGMPMKDGMAPPAPLAAAPAGATTMAVATGDMWIRPHYAVIGQGRIKFTVHNTGGMVHETVIEPLPVKFEKPGIPSEKTSMGEAPDISPGQTKSFTVRLKPGSYQLFCNRPGHYAAGQHYDFTVTG
jgi:uncharacterized cupredoxin-like copper-binding protein